MRRTSIASCVFAMLALGGCGSALKGGSSAHASVPVPAGDCSGAVLRTLDSVLQRVYREGVESERTASAEAIVESSVALRRAVESDSAGAARTAATALLATGHMTDLEVVRGGHTLVSVGGPALAPLRGTLKSAAGSPIAGYVTSVWANSGFTAESSGLAEGLLELRLGGHSIGGSAGLPAGPLPAQGTITLRGGGYRYASFTGQSYPSGSPVEIYLLKPLAAARALCGKSAEQSVVNTLTRVANLIYDGETGSRSAVQVSRVQHNRALQLAVARHDLRATRAAIVGLLNQHIVRLRVSDTRGLLSDVGGPYVLAPLTAGLRSQERTVGSFVLSIQDDEGYLRLLRRLAGLDVLMYMGSPGPGAPHQELVKNSLGPSPGSVPASGPFSYHGHSFRVITVHARAFPSGPLTVRVLIPVPYS